MNVDLLESLVDFSIVSVDVGTIQAVFSVNAFSIFQTTSLAVNSLPFTGLRGPEGTLDSCSSGDRAVVSLHAEQCIGCGLE